MGVCWGGGGGGVGMATKEMGRWGFSHTALGSHSLLYTFILHSYSSSGVLQCRAEGKNVLLMMMMMIAFI